MSRLLTSSFCFSFHRVFAFVAGLVARHVALHRVSIRTLDELFIVQARCRLGFERRIDAAIYRTAFTAKVGSQSSEHGVIPTGKHSHLSSCCRAHSIYRVPIRLHNECLGDYAFIETFLPPRLACRRARFCGIDPRGGTRAVASCAHDGFFHLSIDRALGEWHSSIDIYRSADGSLQRR